MKKKLKFKRVSDWNYGYWLFLSVLPFGALLSIFLLISEVNKSPIIYFTISFVFFIVCVFIGWGAFYKREVYYEEIK